MSQNDKKFQSKGKKFGGGVKGRGKPEGGKFNKRFEGDRAGSGESGGKRFSSRDDRGGDRRGGDKKPYGDRRDSGGKRDYKDGGKRYSRDDRGGDRKSYGDKKPYGDKRPYADRRDSGGKRPYGDKKPYGDRREGGGKDFRDNRNFGDRSSFGQKKGFRNDKGRAPRKARDFELDDDFEAEIRSKKASPETLNKLKSDRPGYGSPSSAFLYGVHAVRAAILNPKRLHQRLLVTGNGFEQIRDAYEAAQGEGLRLPQPMYVESVDIERLLPRDAVHQGILLDSQPLEEVFLSDVLVGTEDRGTILVLDQVTDPHNIGAILRSAAAFGAAAVVVQKIHAPEITGTVAKSASGAAEHVPLIREVNLSRALEKLKQAGYFCIGLAEEGKAELAELHLQGKVALVLGAEGEGLRRLVSENRDVLARLPTGGPIGSLNVSNAAAVALYELARNGAPKP